MKNISIIVIPAYEPDQKLLDLVTDLSVRKQQPIVVVDDGSSSKTSLLFEVLKQNPQVTILRHHKNLGKGKALKTAFQYILNSFKSDECCGVVTADADGQHLGSDIFKVLDRQLLQPEALIVGARDFRGKVPFGSCLGNYLTRFIFKMFSGKKLQDTQTGLRAIPYFFIAKLLDVSTNAYDFELEMLIRALQQNIVIDECAIQTIYHKDNSHSHFHPLRDSFKVYFVFWRFWFSK